MTNQESPAGQSEPTGPSEQPSSREAWQEVGREFEALGASLASALRSARQRSDTAERTEGLQQGLRAMIDQLRQAIEEGTATPEAQQVRAEAARTAETVRTAAEATVQEVRPALVNALRQLNEEIARLSRGADRVR
jgi:chromosome segregation ATPase